MNRVQKNLILIVAGIICAALLSLLCVVKVPTGHTGVVVTFGKVENHTLDSGIHFKAPWQSIIKMDNRIQKETVALSAFSKDIQEVNMVYTVNYQKRGHDHLFDDWQGILHYSHFAKRHGSGQDSIG